jgi:hypothetical protein
LEIENLEDRLVPAISAISGIATVGNIGFALPTPKHVILDFGGGFISNQEMQQGGWNTDQSPTVSSFGKLFATDWSLSGIFNPHPNASSVQQASGDWAGDYQEESVAIGRILSEVRSIFAPYNVDFTLGDHVSNQGVLTDAQVGDAIVMITGGQKLIENVAGPTTLGESPGVDVGNQHDELAFVYAGNFIHNGVIGWDGIKFDHAIAHQIAQQLGHCFGLYNAGGFYGHDYYRMEVARGDVMSPNGQTGQVFPDVAMPDVNGAFVNEHQYLLNTLGASSNAWNEVLTPGTLTIMGNDYVNNSIRVDQGTDGSWFVTVNGSVQKVQTAAYSPLWYYYYAQSFSNLNNPFPDVPLSQANIFGRGFADTIIVFAAVDLYAWGGAGFNYIYGGGANSAHIWGGNAGNVLIGSSSGNNWLTGGTGVDYLFGGAGTNVLDGGPGLSRNYLYGGIGHNIFYQYRDSFGRVDRDLIYNFHTGDVIYTGIVYAFA